MNDVPMNSEFERTVEDPVARFAIKWWKELAVTVAVALVVAVAVSLFSSAKNSQKENASQAFSNLQRSYTDLATARINSIFAKNSSESKTKIEEAKKKFDAILTAFGDTGAEYKSLADTYRILGDSEGGQLESYKALPQGSDSRFLLELATLGAANRLLDIDQQKGVNTLLDLAKNGGAVTAAASLETLSIVAPALSELPALTKDVGERYPEVRAILEK